MQEVSEKWKSAHKQTLLNEGFVEVSLAIADPDSLADNKEVQDNGAIYISNSSELTNGVEKSPTPYCTLEQNLWVLDGNRKHIPESANGSEGFVSDVMSDDVCAFTDKIPTLTIDFSKEFTSIIPGVTITWSEVYNEFATDFLVRAFNGDTVVAEREVLGNRSVTSPVLLDISGYDRIVVYVKKWCLPNRRARVEEIFIGLKKVYTKSDLFDFTHTQSASLLSLALPKSEIKYSVNNLNGEFNPYNDSGLSKYIKERQEVKTRYGLKMNDGTIEWIKGGTFYLSDWYAKQNGLTADFTARDKFEYLTDVYKDWKFTPNTRRDMYDLAELLLNAANLPEGSAGWSIDESLKGVQNFGMFTTAPLPEDTIGNNLQLVANAAKCVLYQDREGVIRIEPLKLNAIYDTDYEISSFNSYSKAEISLSKPIRQVKVKTYSYPWNDEGTGLGDITSEEVSYPADNEISKDTTGETIILDNPIITNKQGALELAEHMYSYLKNRKILESSWRADTRLDALDVVKIPHNYITDQVCMTDVEVKYNGAFRATGKGEVISNG